MVTDLILLRLLGVFLLLSLVIFDRFCVLTIVHYYCDGNSNWAWIVANNFQHKHIRYIILNWCVLDVPYLEHYINRSHFYILKKCVLVIGVAEMCLKRGALCCVCYSGMKHTTPMQISKFKYAMSCLFSSRFTCCPFLYTQM